jgi:flavin reductase (DIM6/NTAB) family NADH-FMN oxidoreductase RutF
VRLECRLFALVPHGSGASAGTYVIAEVVHLHAAAAVLTDRLPDPRKLDVIARLGGDFYTRVGPDTLFELPRPGAS